jgi:hypothetical protein
MANQWYYSRAGKKEGPVSSQQLKQLAECGDLRPTDHVWKEGMAQWTPASRIKGLFPPPGPGATTHTGTATPVEMKEYRTASTIAARRQQPATSPGVTSPPTTLGPPPAPAPCGSVPSVKQHKKLLVSVTIGAVMVLALLAVIIILVNQDKKDPAQPAGPPPTPAADADRRDPLAAKLTKTTSGIYTDTGFKQYVFGTSTTELQNVTTLVCGLNQLKKETPGLRALGRYAYTCGLDPRAYGGDGWMVNDKDEVFHLADNRLMGFGKVYKDDNKSYLDSLSDLFGKSINVYHHAVVEKNATFAQRADVGCHYYFFPKTAVAFSPVNVRQVYIDPFSKKANAKAYQYIELCMFDRKYFDGIVDNDFKVKRKALAWLKTVVDQERQGRLDFQSLPVYPAADQPSMTAGNEDVRLTDAAHIESFFVASKSIAQGKTGPARPVEFRMNFYQLPGRSNPIVRLTVFDSFMLHAYALLTQEFFPSKEPTVNIFPTRTRQQFRSPKCYEWQTADGWTVAITEEGVEVTRKSTKSLN